MGKKDKPKKPLTGLAAALVKAGKLDEKKARDLEREKRREEKALGREGVAALEAQRAAEAAARKAAQAEADRSREQARVGAEARERAERVIHDNRVQTDGRRRWFFVSRGGAVRFLEVDDDTARLLLDGQAGITESLDQAPDAHTVVLTERALVTLTGIDKELVRFWNREGPPPRRD